jgi:hypothetical protein
MSSALPQAQTPQLPWTLFTAQPSPHTHTRTRANSNSNSNAPAYTILDPELEALVESLTKRIAAPLPSLSFAPLPGHQYQPYQLNSATPRIPATPAARLIPTTPTAADVSASPMTTAPQKTLARRQSTSFHQRRDGSPEDQENVPPVSSSINKFSPAPVQARAPNSTSTASASAPHAAQADDHDHDPIRSKDVLALLTLLDSTDASMAIECQRIRDSIADVRTLSTSYRSEREDRLTAARMRREKEKQETKEVGGDFWAGV